MGVPPHHCSPRNRGSPVPPSGLLSCVTPKRQYHDQVYPRKAAAAKAHRTYRKPATTAATKKAHGTYRKTAAQFEEFARAGQTPKSIRTFAEKSVVQTRELWRTLSKLYESWERFVDAGQGAVELNRKAIDIARRNINSGFGLAVSLVRAKNLAEAMELQATYWRKQLGELVAEAGEMRTLSTKVTADVAAPIKAQVTRGMIVLHKAT